MTDIASQTFATTHWSVVLLAREKGLPQSGEALEHLCRNYWPPLYVYLRRSGHSREDAEDLAQAFFTRLLEKNYLDTVVPERGRFRTFLLVALKRFIANEWDRARALKRGGGIKNISLDMDRAEGKFEAELAIGTSSPDRMYDRRWALALVDQAMTALRREYEDAGKTDDFERLKPFLVGRQPETADKNDGALRVAVHRLRKRYRELIRREIAQTLAEGEDLEDEFRYLFTILSDH